MWSFGFTFHVSEWGFGKRDVLDGDEHYYEVIGVSWSFGPFAIFKLWREPR